MIELRDVRPEDKDMIRRWRNLPEVREYMYTDDEISAEEHERWFERATSDPTRKYWIIVSDGKDVGLVNLCDIDLRNRRCSAAFYVAESSMRGRGVGQRVEYMVIRYVFEELGLNRLYVEVLALNPRGVEMHKSFGFVQEGCYRQHVIKGGRAVDVVALAILRQDWESQKPAIEARLRSKGLI